MASARSRAVEYASNGVLVIAVAPGPVYIGVVDHQLTESLCTTTLLGRAAQPEEIRDIIVFLASGRAGYITGALLPIDAGRTTV